MLGFIQNALNFLTSTMGISFITLALAIGLLAVLARWMYWHTFFEMAAAGGAFLTIAAIVATVYG